MFRQKHKRVYVAREKSWRLVWYFEYAERAAAVRLHRLEAIKHCWQALTSWHEIEQEFNLVQKNKKQKQKINSCP